MPPALKHEAHALQEPRLRPIWVVDIERQSVVVFEVRSEGNTILELLIQDLSDGVGRNVRLEA
eukprot:12178187-Alexandrium_andersonii.AAC.1